MATHSSVLAWRIPWTEEPGGLQSMGSQSRTRLSNLARTHATTTEHLFCPAASHLWHGEIIEITELSNSEADIYVLCYKISKLCIFFKCRSPLEGTFYMND